MSQVTVIAHPEKGTVVTSFEGNPEYGAIRVDSTELIFGEDGWGRKSNRSALIRGRVSELEEFGFSANQKVRGKIIQKSSNVPFYDGQSPKINPSTMEEVLDAQGHNIYTNNVFVTDLNATDYFVDNEEVNITSEAVQTAIDEQAV